MPSKIKEPEPSAGVARHSTTGLPMWPRGYTPAPRLATPIYQCSVHFSDITTGGYENVMHFQPDTTPSGDIGNILNDLMGGFQDNVQNELLACTAADITLAGYTARRITDGSPTASLYVGAPGLGSGPVDNTAIACLISFEPADSPWKFGHFYLGGVNDIEFAANYFQSTYTAKANAVAQKLSSPFTSVGGLGIQWNPVIYSRKTGVARTIARWVRHARPSIMSRRLYPWLGGGEF